MISDKFVGWAQTVNGYPPFRTAVEWKEAYPLAPRFVLSRMIRVEALNSGKAARAAIRSDLHQIHQLRPGHCVYQILRRGVMRAVLWDDGVVSGIRDDKQVALDIPYEVPSPK